MKYFVLVILSQMWSVVILQPTTTDNSLRNGFLQGAGSLLAAAVETVDKKIKDISPLTDLIGVDCVKPPIDCPNDNVTFWYYSRYRKSPIELSVSNPRSFNRVIKNKKPWKIIIHGYSKNKDEIPNPELRSAYFKRGFYNLLSVDYAPLAKKSCYASAVHNVPVVAKCTAQMINTLLEKGYYAIEDLHVIGFSLGAQVAGHIYAYLFGKKPGRVTALDPAFPFFDGVLNRKLSPDAGTFVDVIHTNSLMKGTLEASGHIDFYVNGGINQPGCRKTSNDTSSNCSHNRAPLYYAESINSETGFWGIRCENYIKFYSGLCKAKEEDMVIMGEYTPTEARGVYYLQTMETDPFALGKKISKS